MSVLGPFLVQDVGTPAPMSGIPAKDGVNFTQSVWGTPIPLTQGIRKVTGVPIWAGQPFQKTSQTAVTVNGSPEQNITTTFENFSISRDFAVAFGYNLASSDAHAPPQVRRVWADGQLIYSVGESVPPVSYHSASGSYSFGENVIGNQQTVNGKPTNPPLSSNLTFRFYTGTEDQTPDPLIFADKGDLAPAFRGMMYMVIEGLIVGQGAHLTDQVTVDGYTKTFPPGAIGGVLTQPLDLPVIVAELMDGESLGVQIASVDLLPGSPSASSQSSLIVDWNERRYVTIKANTILTFDIDGKAETSVTPITGLAPGQNINFLQGLLAWDITNDILYSYSDSPGRSLISINRKTGAIIDSWGQRGFDLGPLDEDFGDPTVTGKDCIGFGYPTGGAIGYYVEAGAAKPVLVSALNSVNVNLPSSAGVFQESIPAAAVYKIDTDFSPGIQPFPLIDTALQQGVVNDQDACFVVSYGRKVDMVFIQVRGGKQKIVARPTIYTAPLGYTVQGFLDAKGNVVCYASATSQDTLITKIAISVDQQPDYAIAPGWRGVFPHVKGTLYNEVVVPGGPAMVTYLGPNSDLSQNTAYVGNNVVVNLNDGSSKTVDDGGSGIGILFSFWDSATSTRYDNNRYSLFGGGLGGSIGTLKDYLRALALQAGYTDGDLEIDPSLTDPIVGVMIQKPYDINQLFNDLSVVYNFLYLNTGGKLKFMPTTRNPEKATVTYTVANSGPADGATATIGGVVYTFRTTPAAPFDVLRGATLQDTIINFVNAINGTGTGFFDGTTAHGSVTASVSSGTTALITAKQGGPIGNSITTSRTGGNQAFSSANLIGGSEPPEPDVTLTIDDLMFVQDDAITDSDALITTIGPPNGTPTASALDFFSLEQDYQVAEQRYIPDDQGGNLATASYGVQTYDIPIVMSMSEAYSRVVRVALSSTENEVAQEFQLTQKFIRLEPNDVIGINMPPYRYIVRIDEATYNGDFSLSLSGYNYSYRNDVNINDVPALGTIPQSVPGLGDSVAVALDIPILDPAAGSVAGRFTILEGARPAFSQNGWTGATIYLNGQALFDVTKQVPFGNAQAALPATDTPSMTDNDTQLVVFLKNPLTDQFTSISTDDLYAGKNLICIGAPGRWELIYFRDVVATGTKQVTLSGLIRGRRGTEGNTDNHEATDEVYLLASAAESFVPAIVQGGYGVAQVGETFNFSAAGAVTSRAPAVLALEAQGQTLWPWAPVQVAAVASGSDVDLSWVRRDRLTMAKFVTENIALSETVELYDLEIMDGDTVKRTVEDLTSPSYTYLAADIASDGFTGPLASIKVRVYQKGELGRGFMKETTADVQ